MRKTTTLLTLGCGLTAALWLTGCVQGTVGNPNGELTVINGNSAIGTVYVNDEPCKDVKAVSYYDSVEVDLRAETGAASRGYFKGWEFQGLFERDVISAWPEPPFLFFLPSSEYLSLYCTEKGLRIAVDPEHRVAIAHFEWEKNTDARFLDENRVLYHDNRGAKSTWRIMPVSAGAKAGSSVIARQSGPFGTILARSFPSNPWIHFTVKEPIAAPYSSADGYDTSLALTVTEEYWSADAGSAPRTLDDIFGMRVGRRRCENGAPNGNLLIAVSEAYFWQSDLSENNNAPITYVILDRSGRQVTRNAELSCDDILYRDYYGPCVLSQTKGSYDAPPNFSLINVETTERLKLTAADNPSSAAQNDLTGYTIEFKQFSPDGSGNMLFTGTSVNPTTFETTHFALVLAKDGSIVCRLDSGMSGLADVLCSGSLYWTMDGTGLAETLNTHCKIPLTSPHIPVHYDGPYYNAWFDGNPLEDYTMREEKTLDLTVSPSGAWKLEEIQANGPIDVGLRAADANAGTGTNLTIDEGEQ